MTIDEIEKALALGVREAHPVMSVREVIGLHLTLNDDSELFVDSSTRGNFRIYRREDN